MKRSRQRFWKAWQAGHRHEVPQVVVRNGIERRPRRQRLSAEETAGNAPRIGEAFGRQSRRDIGEADTNQPEGAASLTRVLTRHVVGGAT